MRAHGNALHQCDALTLMADQGVAPCPTGWTLIKEIAIRFNNVKSY